jgi:hypothetical protein
VLVVLDGGIGAREEEGVVIAVFPAHDVRWFSIWAPHFYHLAVAIRLSDPVAVDHNAISYARTHDVHLSARLSLGVIVVPVRGPH